MIRAASERMGLAQLFVPPALASLLCWRFSPNEISSAQALLAFLLLIFPWTSFLSWRERKAREVPVFALIAFMHWVFFAQPLFWGGRRLPGFSIDTPPELITATLFMAVLGVAALWLGMHTRILPWDPARLPDLTDNPISWPYLRLAMLAGMLLSWRASDVYVLGEGGRNIMILLQTVLPSTLFAFFFRKYVGGTAPWIDRALVFLFLASRALIGLSSGWLGTIVWPVVICALVYITEGRRIPILTTTLLIGSVLFLQVGKTAFREAYWNREAESAMTDRLEFWVDESMSRWVNALEGTGSDNSRELASQTVSRLSLLTHAAHVLDWTPERVPFQYGQTYSYFAVTLIPRFLWPDKPSVNEANRFYQVAYGLTAHNELDRVSIAVGFLTEGYINFGWWGVVGVTYLVGLLLGIFQETFVGANSTVLFRSLGLALTPGFLVIEAQLAQYMGGFAQQAGLALLILLPVIRVRTRKPAAPAAGAPAVRMGPLAT